MQHVKGLDTLRAFAVFLVIIEHFGVWFDDTSPSGRFIRQVIIPDGGFGLQLFFVLSGFLITGILLEARDNAGSKGLILRNFYVRRALRIFPIYYLLVAALYLVRYPDIREHIGYYLTYTFNVVCHRTNSWNSFSHTWTLDVEEQFYLLWPVAVLFTPGKYFRQMALAAIATGIATTWYAINRQGHMAPLLVQNSLDAFALGGLYAWHHQQPKRESWFRRKLLPAAIVATTAYFIIKGALLTGTMKNDWLFLTKTINSIVALQLIIIVVNAREGLVKKYLLENAALNYLGKISYGIYLYHYVYINYCCGIVNAFFYKITLPAPTLNAIIHDHHVDYWLQVAIMVVVAAVSYRFIEQPLLKLKDKFSYKE